MSISRETVSIAGAPYVSSLAQAGFLVACVDAVGHGARHYPEFDDMFNQERWGAQFEAVESDYLTIVRDTAAEVPSAGPVRRSAGWPPP